MTYSERMQPLFDLARRLACEGETKRLRDAALRVWLEKHGDSAAAQTELLQAAMETSQWEDVRSVHWAAAMEESDE